MTPGIARANVSSVVSIAKHLQDVEQMKGLELTVSQHLPPELPEGAEIPDEAMYGLGEILRIDPKYINQAMKLYSNSIHDVFEALKEFGAEPGDSLREEWLKSLREGYMGLIIPFLNEITNPEHPFVNLGPSSRIYSGVDSFIGYVAKPKNNLKRIFCTSERASGRVIFNYSGFSSNESAPVGVTLEAFTKGMLPLFSGPLRELSVNFPGVSSCKVRYCPKPKDVYILGKKGFLEPAVKFVPIAED